MERHILYYLPIPMNQQVRGHPQSSERGKIGMHGGIKRVSEQRINPGAAEFARWQADAVDYDEIHSNVSRTIIAVQ